MTRRLDDWSASCRRHGARAIAAAFIVVVLAMLGGAARAALPTLTPQQLGLDPVRLEAIAPTVKAAIAANKMPGCVVAIGRTGGVAMLEAYGDRRLLPEPRPMTVDTVFDLASLTKPLATGLSVMTLVEQGKLRLRAPVAEYIPEFAANHKEAVTVEQLLIHHSGFIPDNPLADYEQGPAEAWRRLYALAPHSEPGTKFIYSDVNFEVLGELVRRVSGMSVNEYAHTHIYAPLGLQETGYLPEAALRERAAPTEQRDGRWMQGEVHDPRSFLLGGVAGHAGLFSTASDLAVICDELLRTIRQPRGKHKVLSHAGACEMIRPRDVSGARRSLAWDAGSSYSTNRGELFSPRAFGHGGFTGTAMWIDPELDLFVIFLSNRVHPDGKGNVNDLAGRIGSIAAAAITRPNRRGGPAMDALERAAASPPAVGGAKPQAEVAPTVTAQASDVLCGVDVLEREQFAPLAGKRVGLITNHTGVNLQGTPTIELLAAAPGVKLAAIFSPEHGIAGQLDQSNIGDAKYEKTGTPIFSLYGKTNRPSGEQLAELDALVFDIQDVGARFYTYMSTMGLAIEAAAEAKLPIYVLDRPNPIGGLGVEGPVRDDGRQAFVAHHTIPVRHGMTAGELARMFNAERKANADLHVIAAENWRRGQLWDATGLTWINPSPNMRSLRAALLYPGVGLIEFTNVSVGRGTDTPFEHVGAPWIDAREFAGALNAANLPGIRFIPVSFTPNASRHERQLCHGAAFSLVDRDQVNPVDVGLTLAITLHRLYGDKWEVDKMDRLLLDAAVLEAIKQGKSLVEIHELYRDELADFMTRRAKFLLYSE